ncbi:MAG: hypothetical protein AAFR39_12910 [Pseudomonadota bacterium]
MTGQSEKPKNKWRRRLIVFAVIIGCYFAAGEAFRAYARAELEKDMRTNFEKLGCPPDQIEGDVCLAYPDEGRCISGEYIDYRTVWLRVHGRQEIVDLIGRQYNSFGRDKQKLANWLACQGFSRPTIRGKSDLRPDASSRLFYTARHYHGVSVARTESVAWMLSPIVGARETNLTILFNSSDQIIGLGATTQRISN